MQTIIFADRTAHGKEAIEKRFCPALLPVAGRPTIIHTIEDLAIAGIKKVYLVISSQAHEIESLLGDGARWGMQIKYILSKGEQQPSVTLKRIGRQLSEPYLLIRGDILRSPILKDFMINARSQAGDTIHVRIQGKHAGVVLSKKLDETEIDKLEWPKLKDEVTQEDCCVSMQQANLNYLDTMNEFFTTSLSIAKGEFRGIHHHGLRTENGVVHAKNLKLDQNTTIDGTLYAGNNVRIGSGVKIYGSVIVSDGVMIDKGAILRNCIVLPDTYVGCEVNIENAIVSTEHIYRIDSGIHLRIDDDFLLSHLSRPLAPLIDRFIALLLLVASFPLSTIAAVMAILFHPGESRIPRKIKSNRLIPDQKNELVNRQITINEWNLSIPLLRYLPALLAVIKGDLRLIGADPSIEQIDRENEIFYCRHPAPQYGLISSASIELPINTSVFDKRINERLYDRKRTLLSDIRFTFSSLRNIFSRLAWSM
jgi:NDP-sugar pyrophosphorylase family protein